MKNTSINLANFVLTTANRLAVTNIVYFFYSDANLGLVSTIIAFNSLAVFGASVFELQLAKNLMRLQTRHIALLASNILLVFIAASATLSLGMQSLVFLLLLYALLNTNLILSGYLFSAQLFFEYRTRCMVAELFELLSFIGLLMALQRPDLAVLGALLIKNVTVTTLGLRLLFSDKAKRPTPDAKAQQSYTELFDVAGNLMVVSAVPLAVSQVFGLGTLGQYAFFRQFFSIGNMIQAAVFRGIWQDHMASNKMKTVIEVFRKATIGAPILVLILGLYFVPEQSRLLFIAIGLSFAFLTWARSRVLVDGHIGQEKKFNYEILFSGVLLAVLSLSYVVDIDFAYALLATVAICGVAVARRPT